MLDVEHGSAWELGCLVKLKAELVEDVLASLRRVTASLTHNASRQCQSLPLWRRSGPESLQLHSQERT